MNKIPASFSRRRFVSLASASVVAVPALGSMARFAHAAPAANSAAESVVADLYRSFSSDQRQQVCFAFDDDKRSNINPNWQITPHKIGSSFYSDKQRELIDRIIRQVSSQDGYDRFQKQMDSDAGGVGNYSMAIFGDPQTEQFEWELTGRHLTLRADGNSVPGAAFGGALVYGHGVGNPKRSLFGYQTQVAHRVFESLNPEQAKQALLQKIPGQQKVKLQGTQGEFQGIDVASLDESQQGLVRETLSAILAPYRQEDIAEAMEILDKNEGVKQLRMAFYQEEDLLNDGVWDLWRIEGPNLVCHFRGAPHVHAFINIGVKG